MQDPMEQLSDNDFFSKVANFLDDAPPEALIKETPVIKRIQDIQHQFDDMSFQNISSSDLIFYHQILQKIYQNLGGGHNE